MSALWILALGASLGYLTFQKQSVQDRLQEQVRKHEAKRVGQSLPAPPDGANWNELRKAQVYKRDIKYQDFDERLPSKEREAILAKQEAASKEVERFNGPSQPEIQGVYCEMVCSS